MRVIPIVRTPSTKWRTPSAFLDVLCTWRTSFCARRPKFSCPEVPLSYCLITRTSSIRWLQRPSWWRQRHWVQGWWKHTRRESKTRRGFEVQVGERGQNVNTYFVVSLKKARNQPKPRQKPYNSTLIYNSKKYCTIITIICSKQSLNSFDRAFFFSTAGAYAQSGKPETWKLPAPYVSLAPLFFFFPPLPTMPVPTYPRDRSSCMSENGPKDPRFQISGGTLRYNPERDALFPYVYKISTHALVHSHKYIKNILIHVVDTSIDARIKRAEFEKTLSVPLGPNGNMNNYGQFAVLNLIWVFCF